MTTKTHRVNIRPATRADVPDVAALLRSYMRETYNDDWHGSAEGLARDGFGQEFEMHVALKEGDLVGFAGWRQAYDLHHCTIGAEVFDMFVVPAARGRSIGPSLVCAIAGEVLRRGGKFLKGQAVDDPSVRRLYQRVAISFVAVECTIAGRALRTMASLCVARIWREADQSFWLARYLRLAHHLALGIDDAHTRLFQRHIQSGIMLHGCPPSGKRGSEAPHLKPRSIMTGGQPLLKTRRRGPLPYLPPKADIHSHRADVSRSGAVHLTKLFFGL